VLVLSGLILAALPLVAAQAAGPPLPETDFALDLQPENCIPESTNPHESALYAKEGWQGPEYERYPEDCRRLKFAVGPLVIKPGQNDVLVSPITIEKPMQDGFVVRFKPDLVRVDGTVPPIEQIHLHHGTWLSVPSYGNSAFAAAGEEKTLFPWPKGYGMPIKATDEWLLLYMVHSAVAQPQTVYITYEVDFVPQAKAERLDLKPAYPLWLDVRPSGYPVFNVQRGYGGDDGVCTWPKEECAKFDPYGQQIVGQGRAGSGTGKDLGLDGLQFGGQAFNGGTLIGIGGHLHPGGLTNDIDVVREVGKDAAGQPIYDDRRVYTGEAVYWDRGDATKPGGPPNSWDFSMEVAGLPWWGVHVRPGDSMRSNATYDTTIQSTYEDMGIAVSLFVPNDAQGNPQAPGVDPFTAPADTSQTCESGGLLAPTPSLCDKGKVTHGHLHENDNFGGPSGTDLTTKRTPGNTPGVSIEGFAYVPGDLTMISMTGIPTVKMGGNLHFENLDAFMDVYHTVTSCAYPCTGTTGTAFPLANGLTKKGVQMDFDSSELGFGPPAIGPAKNTIDWNLPITLTEGFSTNDVVTYYCRIHPGMRGAFEVVE
jgi:plastocyanin